MQFIESSLQRKICFCLQRLNIQRKINFLYNLPNDILVTFLTNRMLPNKIAFEGYKFIHQPLFVCMNILRAIIENCKQSAYRVPPLRFRNNFHEILWRKYMFFGSLITNSTIILARTYLVFSYWLFSTIFSHFWGFFSMKVDLKKLLLIKLTGFNVFWVIGY